LMQNLEPSDAEWPSRLRDLMHHARWSGAETAEKLGVTEAWVSKLRTGKGVFSGTIKARIAELEKLHLRQTLKSGRASPPAESDAVDEPPAPYGEASMIRAEIERRVAEAIRAAGDDRVRLAWLLGQVAEHVRPQSHWADDAARAKLDQLKRQAAAERHAPPQTPLRKSS